MIDIEKLRNLINESSEMAGLDDINAALRELMWRRLKQGKLDKKMDKLQKTIAEVRPLKVGVAGRLRAKMALLKF